jgi:hypothetical protein
MRAGRIQKRVNSYSTRDTIADETDDASALPTLHTPSFPPFSDKGLVIPVGMIRLGGHHRYWRLTAPGRRQVIDKSMRETSMNAPHSKSPSSLQFHYNNIFLKITGESAIVLNRNVQDESIVGQSWRSWRCVPSTRNNSDALTFSRWSLHQAKPSCPPCQSMLYIIMYESFIPSAA